MPVEFLPGVGYVETNVDPAGNPLWFDKSGVRAQAGAPGALPYVILAAGAEKPRLPTESHNTSTSNSTTYNATPNWVKAGGFQTLYSPTGQILTQVPDTLDVNTLATLKNAYDIAALNETGANARNVASIAGSAANTAATESGANTRNAQNIFATAQNQQNQQAFTGAQSAQGLNAAETNQLRTLGSSAIDSGLARAAQTGQFAADYGLKVAQQQMADRQAALGAAKTFSDLSGSADLTGYDRFLAAGGGSLGGAIQARATSLTPRGQLGAARALQVAEQPLPAYAPYTAPTETNPYAQYVAPVNYGSVAPQAAAQAPAPASAPVTAAGPQYTAANAGANAARDNAIAAASAAGSPNGGWAPTPGFAYGTGALGQRRRSAVTAMPSGASMDAVTDRFANGTRFGDARYATGSFMTGDSTDPNDPAAGGAHPEQVTLQDPPGPNNARATVDPLVPPGVGPTDGDAPDDDRTAQLGALLQAIGKFLAGSDEPEPGMPVNRLALGTRRYADGTDGLNPVTHEDQPYIDRVMQMRQSTPGGYDVNPYSSSWNGSMLPTEKAIAGSAYQTATGAPKEDLQATANYYQPLGLSRSSPYRSISLGQ